MARSNTNDVAKAGATTSAAIAAPASNVDADAVSVPASQPSDAAEGGALISNAAAGSAAEAAGASSAGQSPADGSDDASAVDTVLQALADQLSPSADAASFGADGEGSGEILIYPVRSYLDGKEIRQAGGQGYRSAKHDAVSLIAAGLATDKKP